MPFKWVFLDRKITFLALILSLFFFVAPNDSVASERFAATNCKSLTNLLKAEEKYGKSLHSEFMKAFIKFQKDRSNETLYRKAFNLKLSVVKSDVKSGNLAISNKSCFSASKLDFINRYVNNRNEVLNSLIPYLSKPINKEWTNSGYAAYISLLKSLESY
jgi:hypothetical protein